jgi:hypothetical protein
MIEAVVVGNDIVTRSSELLASAGAATYIHPQRNVPCRIDFTESSRESPSALDMG